MFPKTRFEEMYSKVFESMMPTLEYLIWRDQVKMARKSGWTIQERYFNTFFRGYKNVHFHAYAQTLHPFGYLERQRGDAFIRRMETLIPGIEAPAWAFNQHRTPDFDLASLQNITNAYQSVVAESTPKPHYNSTDWNNLAHLFNQRFQGGYYAQRLFFNEEIRGDRYNLGPYGEVDRGLMNSWYANSDNSYLWKMQQYGDAEATKVRSNAEKWIKLIDQHYPEFKTVNCESVTHKHNEPLYERSVAEIRKAILTEKWVQAVESGKFTSDEVEEIKNFFYTDNMHSFFTEEADGHMSETALMKKFNTLLNLPSVMSLNRFTGEIPEHQYNTLAETKNGVDFYTVNQYKKTLVSFTNNDDFRKLSESVKGFSLRTLVSEEVYNPLFKRHLVKKSGSSSNNVSFVCEILKTNPKELDNLVQLFHATREELSLFNNENYDRFLSKVRRVVSTFNFVPK